MMSNEFILTKEDVGEMKDLSPYGLAFLISQRYFHIQPMEIKFQVTGDTLMIKPELFTTSLLRVCISVSEVYGKLFYISNGCGYMY